MFFTFVLASALALSAVLGRSSSPTPSQMTYTKEDQTTIQSNETAQIMAVDDRSSNLKYVMAIQSSGIWSEIKKRSLTINSQQRLDDKAAAKSPGDLSDQELAQLKQACHDGLKCVAVDQLLVLKQVKEPLGDGKVSVRTAITKITQVLTQYTTEYHEDVYQYVAVQQSDDQSKVYQSVTTIVEDNKELCQIGVTAATGESHPKKHPKKHRKKHQKNHDSDHKIVNDGTINYNTTENYNINNGTVNSATITKEPSDIITVAESPESRTRANNGSDASLVIVIAPRPEADEGDRRIKKRSPGDHSPTERTTTTTTGTSTDRPIVDESVTKSPENVDGGRKRRRPNHAQGNGTPDRHNVPVTTTDDHPKYGRLVTGNHRKPAGPLLLTTDGPSPHHDAKAGQQQDRVENNSASLKNGRKNGRTGGGETDNDCDVVNAGSSVDASVRKGYVHDGTLNNGNMVQYNINNGVVNTGKISDSNADGGIISVGTVNNGPVNYGTSDTYTNNGKRLAMSNRDVRQYLSSIDKMYSTILERLGA